MIDFARTPGYISGNIYIYIFFFYSRLRHQKEKAISLIWLPEILYTTFPLTWLPITRHTLWACPSKVLTTQRMHQAEDQRTLRVYTWLLGQLCAVPLLELALMSSEEPATGIGQPAIGDMRKWRGYHEPGVKPCSLVPRERRWRPCLAGKPCRKKIQACQSHRASFGGRVFYPEIGIITMIVITTG